MTPKNTTSPNANPNHTKLKHRLKRVGGQILGIERMINNNRYCPDIITQIKATQAALKGLELEILKSHLNHCVSAAIKSNNQKNKDLKIQEILDLFRI